jgi:N-methylhydantoinase A
MTVRLAIDIGGTFTDAAVLDEITGEITVSKSSTTPRRPIDGVMACVQKAALDPAQVTYFVHGTTAATNAVLQRKLPKLAMVSTGGFADLLEIQRGNRPLSGLYDIRWEKPAAIVARNLRYEVEERVDFMGRVLTPFNERQAREVAKELKRQEVKAVAVCFLFSYVNPDHEKMMRKIIEEECPGAFVSISSDIDPQIREYERSSTVAIDAAVKPVMDLYIGSLEDGLQQAGFKCRLMIMKASGGVMSSAAARGIPVQTIESGPAGGSIGAAAMAKSLGANNLIAIDMGGTTFKVSLIDRGMPRFKAEGEVEWGVPFRMPMIDISEIAAGGGSIAWTDEGGILRVGPHSAGADPGPVCYDRGGTDPTITDAQVVLGRLDPASFLGGDMRLNKQKAIDAVGRLGSVLGLDSLEVAAGIMRIAEANMLASMRVNSVEKGYDPREFSVIAYGGAGPMVAASLTQALGSPRVIIPFHPGIFSAIGMLAADIRFDFIRSYMTKLDDVDIDKLNSLYSSLESQARETLTREHKGESFVIRTADMRYYGQNYEISSPIPSGVLEKKDVRTIMNSFNQEHLRMYGHNKADEPLEIINLRVGIIGSIAKPELRTRLPSDGSRALKGHREVYFDSKRSFEESAVYARGEMAANDTVKGPAVIEEMDSTIIVNPGQTAKIDARGNVVIEVQSA